MGKQKPKKVAAAAKKGKAEPVDFLSQLDLLDKPKTVEVTAPEEENLADKSAAISALKLIGSKSKSVTVQPEASAKALGTEECKPEMAISHSAALPDIVKTASMIIQQSETILKSATSVFKAKSASRASVYSEEYSESSSEEEIATKKSKKKGKKKKEESRMDLEDDKKKRKKEKKEKIEDVEEEKEEKNVEEVKEKRKDKKRKKKGKEKKEKPVKMTRADEKAAQAMFWVNELKRLKALALELGVVDPEAKPEDKGPKKKMSKKERARIAAEQAEKQKAEAEAQCKKLLELMRLKQEEEKKAAIEKDKKEIMEQQWRMEQLEYSDNLINEILNYNMQLAKQEEEESEWQKFLACGKLPIPSQCPQMNTYLHLWEIDMNTATVQNASQRTIDVMSLLNELQEMLETSKNVDPKIVENWFWIRSLFREHQSQNLDVATYNLLRNVEKNLNRIDIPTANFNFKDDNLTFCIWLRVMLPIPLPNPRRPPKPRIDINFELMDMRVLLPIVLDGENAAIRAMYLKYDHLSDLSDNYYMPEIPKEYHRDLFQCMKREWRAKLFYKYQHRDRPPPKELAEGEDAEENVVEEKEEFDSDEDIPIVPFKQLKPTASQTVSAAEDQLYQKTKEELSLDLSPDIINLRQFIIIGGVYYLNYLAQPPQPQDFITMEMQLTGLYLPKKLESIKFEATYNPPEPPTPQSSDPEFRKLPEEIEEEMKKQEEELDKLIFITLTWPQHVIFLELPVVCRWDEEEKVWTKEDIHDLKHNEEKFILSFRTGSFGIFALATYRYANLPFQAYDIKPEADDSLTVQLTAAILMMEFNIKDGLICLTQLQNSPNMALQDLIGSYMKLHQLTRIMKEAGIDIFPSFDAFCYVEGNSEKQWAMEKHLYYNMAQLSICFNFAWSRWNMQAGRRKIVMQMRHYQPLKPKQKNHQMALITPEKATFVDCTEVSQTFSENDSEVVLRFCADLFNLMKTTHSIAIRNTVLQASKENVFTLSQFLISTRILSFS